MGDIMDTEDSGAIVRDVGSEEVADATSDAELLNITEEDASRECNAYFREDVSCANTSLERLAVMGVASSDIPSRTQEGKLSDVAGFGLSKTC